MLKFTLKPVVLLNRRDMAKKVLVCALGMSPGAPYTAILKTSPDVVYLLSSKEARDKGERALVLNVDEMLSNPPDMIFFTLKDPVAGYAEAKEFVSEIASQIRGASLTVNLTGGTTVMQYAIQELVRLKGGRIYFVVNKNSEEYRPDGYLLPGELIFLDAVSGPCL
jgi:hypothetical protein